MFLSIIVPVYNVEKYLTQCVDSILEQHSCDIEIVLVDDGSTDGSGEICKAYKDKYEFIKVIHQQNQGLSSARNTGILNAEGEYLMFVDSDDVILENSLSCLIESVKNSKANVALVLPKELNEDLTKVIKEHKPFDFDEQAVYKASLILDQMYLECGIAVTLAQTKIVSRKFLLENDLFFTKGIYHEDDDFLARLYLTNPTITFISKEVYGYRRRENSIVTTKDNKAVKKKVADKINIALKLFEDKRIFNHKKMLDYFLTYFMGAYIQNLRCGGEEVKIPFKVFRLSPSKKVKILGWLRLFVGYRISKRVFIKYLLGRA